MTFFFFFLDNSFQSVFLFCSEDRKNASDSSSPELGGFSGFEDSKSNYVWDLNFSSSEERTYVLFASVSFAAHQDLCLNLKPAASSGYNSNVHKRGAASQSLQSGSRVGFLLLDCRLPLAAATAHMLCTALSRGRRGILFA